MRGCVHNTFHGGSKLRRGPAHAFWLAEKCGENDVLTATLTGHNGGFAVATCASAVLRHAMMNSTRVMIAAGLLEPFFFFFVYIPSSLTHSQRSTCHGRASGRGFFSGCNLKRVKHVASYMHTHRMTAEYPGWAHISCRHTHL